MTDPAGWGTVVAFRLRPDMEARIRAIVDAEANSASAVLRRLVAAGLKATDDRADSAIEPELATTAAGRRG